MANKRISELAPITAVQLANADLLLLSDVSAQESKKLQLTDLGSFLLSDGRLTGSLFGTASYALNAGTASYAINSTTPTLVASASFLVLSPGVSSGTASYALASLSASNAQTASLARTASYALTSSFQSIYSSSFADYAKSASYLVFTPGVNNGTASYALTASSLVGGITQTSSSYAATSSVAITASYVAVAIETVATASYLQYVGFPNGTASYALVAGGVGDSLINYGIFRAITQSISSSQLDVVSILPTFGGLKDTEIEAYGTIRLPFTASGPTDGNIELWVVDRGYGFSQSLDSSPITAFVVGTSSLSGTLRIPFTLAGQASLDGLFKVYVTASNGVFIDNGRTCRFNISSVSDQLSVYSGGPMVFTTTPTNSIMLWSSSLHPANSYYGSASQVTFSGSYDVTKLLIPPSSVTTMSYTWTLTSCSILIVNNNVGLTNIGGLPSGIISMSAANCSLVELPLLASSSISYLNVPVNNIDNILPLPDSMSYIDVSYNALVTLPTNLPYGLTALLADGLSMTSTPSTMSNTLISMSFESCPNLDTWVPGTFPTSLTYLSTKETLLANIPASIPSPLLYVDVSSGSLVEIYISSLAQGLVTNGLSNGILDFTNNPNSASAINIFPNMATLRSRGWTVNGF